MSLHGRPVAVALLLLLVIGLRASAQYELPPASETIDVSIINLDVFVTDNSGKRVYGLTADDFEIRENGRPQPISNFAEYAPETKRADGAIGVEGGHPRAVSQSSASAAPPSKRTIVIFIDLVPQPSARVREVFASLREFVNQAVRPGDAATVVAFESRLFTRQRFTDDRNALNAALSQLEDESIGLAPSAIDAARRAAASDQAAAMLAAGAGKGSSDVANSAALERRAGELFGLVNMRRKTAAMTSIMESLSGIEGKKIMVLSLHNYGLKPGFDAFAETTSANFPLDSRVERLRQAVMRTANANGVTLYPFHPPGMLWTNQGNAQEVRPDVMKIDSDMDLLRAAANNATLTNQTASLIEIAKETGGLMAAGPSAIVELLPRVVDDLESYYSLAYRATPTGKDARRKVVVTAKNRNYQVRSRRAVVEKSDDTQMDDRVVANLFQPVEHSVIPVGVKLGALVQTGKKRWRVPVTVRVPMSALTMSAGETSARGSVSLFVGTGADFGVISDVSRRTQEYSIKTADLESARRSHFTYETAVEVDQLATAISIGVRDDVSKEYGLVRMPLPARDGAKEKRGGSLE